MFPNGLDNVNLSNGLFFPVFNSFPGLWQFFPAFPGFSWVYPTALGLSHWFFPGKPNPASVGLFWALNASGGIRKMLKPVCSWRIVFSVVAEICPRMILLKTLLVRGSNVIPCQ